MKLIYIASLESIHTIRWLNYFADFKEYDITCISLTKSDNKLNKNISLLELNGVNFILNIFKVIALISSKSNSLLHVHYLGWHSLLLAFVNKKNKIILTPWGSDIYLNKQIFIKRLWLKYIFSKSHFIVCDSYKLISAARKLGARRLDYKVISFGTNTKKYICSKEPFSKNKDLKKIIIGTNRAMEKIYDPLTFLKAANYLLKKNKNFEFLMANDGSLKNKIINFINKNKLQKSIKLIGRKEGRDNIKFYCALDIYISTSLSDGGLAASIAEAMSCRRLVIVSDNSENSNYIKHGLSGYLFPNKDYIKLANIIDNAAKYPRRSAEIAKKGRKEILKNCNYFKEMKKVKNIYNKILK